MSKLLFHDLSYQVLGICFKVHSSIGCGLPEHCYSKALAIEFDHAEIPYTRERRFDVDYDGAYVGHFFTDFIIDGKIILELKSDDTIHKGHISQLITYLKALDMKVGYVIAFGDFRLKYKRFIL